MQNRQAASRPSIYYFHPALGGAMAGWSRHLDRCATMGFSHLLLAPLFQPGRSGNIFLTADHQACHPALQAGGSAASQLRDLAGECRRRGIGLWLDLVLDRVAREARVVAEHPRWFIGGGEDPLPDPRSIIRTSQAARFAYENGASAEILAWWKARIDEWLEAGVDGFRLDQPQAIPPHLLKEVIAAAKATQPECRFVAWTPGLTPAEIKQLEDCGVDFTVASTCWWDFKGEWFLEEQAKLAAVAPPLALAEAPFARRLAEQFASSDALELGYRRVLDVCATDGNGWLMPMGFEFGNALPLDTVRADPAAFERHEQASNIRLIDEIAAANDRAAKRFGGKPVRWRVLSAPQAPVFAQIAETADAGTLRLVNAEARAAQVVDIAMLLARAGRAWALQEKSRGLDGTEIHLQPAEVLLLKLTPAATVKLPTPQSKRQATAAAKVPRVAITHVAPAVEGGEYPAKRVVGERVTVEADIFSDGHGELAADLLWRAADEADWRRVPMKFLGNDHWTAHFRPERVGDHLFTIEAWRDDFASLQHGSLKKRDAGIAIELEFQEMSAFLDRHVPPPAERGEAVKAFMAQLHRAKKEERRDLLLSKEAVAALRDVPALESRIRHQPPIPLTVDRGAAMFSSWYEIFPRSMSGTPERHGTFDDVIAQLPRIAAMGFDTLYFPPIHPIGRVNRKGKNNNTRSEPGEVGSPYAIGSDEGGHDAIHPELGTIEDFRRMRDAAAGHGLEIALDFAIQCAPDHPWLKQHPEWFAWRPDGTIAYAENPPKKYEDIVNVDFYAPGAVPGLWLALRDIFLYWRQEGVRTFRVDNPHTKPLPFWRWVIADIRARFPDTLFLSEAFTRPQVMYELAKVGFSQSYTYFTWRNTKAELESYLKELADGPPKDFFRPHFFVNTPDINPTFLQRSGRAGFLIRAGLAATMSGLWGVYSGFELCEGTPLPGKEEYLDSEKYEIRAWDWNRPGNINAEIAQLNHIRRRNPALQTHLGIRFIPAANDSITAFIKSTPERDNVILVAINLDPFHAQEAWIEIPLWEWSLPDHASIDVEDLVRGTKFQWQGKSGSIRLDPYELPYSIWRIAVPAGDKA
ncbi:maltotransferase domain-containing protein [Dongia sp.]|uniref:maltotransferase domain-containing protein n=1 Tax=Dongia sp. TaxID=1977262 RepID=UPI0037536C0D